MERALQFGIDLILYLQQFSPGWDPVFKALTFLGEEAFYLLLLPVIYWCFDKKAGIRLMMVFLFSAWVNATAKTLANQPRPFQYDSRVRALAKAGGGGLPSGHTQHTVVAWGFLAAWFRNKWILATALALMVLIPLSRLYLGVHFPTDLIGGYVLGAVILFSFLKIEPWASAWLAGRTAVVQAALAVGAPLFLIILFPGGDPSGPAAASTLMGACLGLMGEKRFVGFVIPSTWGRRLLILPVGLAALAAVYIGLKTAFNGLEPAAAFRFVRYFLVGFLVSFIGPWLFVRLGLARGAGK
ncbi:MAG: phosphatase PAP2 family protein [Pseudomonadota bacterium]